MFNGQPWRFVRPPFGPPPFGRPPRLFEKGDLKYVILNLIKDKPSHGYEIIRAMEEHFHGFYTPSAGSVYPTLQLIEDMGYVSSSERDGKKVYTITESGKKFLNEQQDVIERIKNQMKDWWGPRDTGEFHEAMNELNRLNQLLGQRVQQLGAENWQQIKNIIARTCQEVEVVLKKG
jgi:DNA-binding PadR family transcriptional regulator